MRWLIKLGLLVVTQCLFSPPVFAQQNVFDACSQTYDGSYDELTVTCFDDINLNYRDSYTADVNVRLVMYGDLSLANESRLLNNNNVNFRVEFPNGGDLNLDYKAALSGSVYGAGSVEMNNEAVIAGDVVNAGKVQVGYAAMIDGYVEASDEVKIGGNAQVSGYIESQGKVETENNVTIAGYIDSAKKVKIGDSSTINGYIQSSEDIEIGSRATVSEFLDSDDKIKVGQRVTLGGDIRAQKDIEVGQDSEVQGDVTSDDGKIKIDFRTEVKGSLLARRDIDLEQESHIFGDVNARNGEVKTGFRTKVDKNIDAEKKIKLGQETEVGGSLDANDEISLAYQALVKGNVNSRDSVKLEQRSKINGYLNTPNFNDFVNESPPKVLGELCDINNNYGPCSEAPVDLEQCSAIWPSGVNENSTTPERYDLPGQAYNRSLPRELSNEDYLRVGDFDAVGEEYQTSGASSRVYIDGDLNIQPGVTLNPNGNPEDFILIVTGDLSISAGVTINGYIYAEDDINFSNNGPLIVINGAISAGDDIQGSNYRVNYSAFSNPIEGGNFCAAPAVNLPPAQVYLPFDDGPWNASNGFAISNKGTESLSITARNGVGFGAADGSPALATNQQFMGTCGYATFSAASQHYIEIMDDTSLDRANEYTIAFWARIDRAPRSGLATLVGKDENFELHVTPQGTINWWWQGNKGVRSNFTQQSFADGQWHFFVARYSLGRQSLWIDGEQKLSFSYTDTLVVNNDALRIGADKGNDGNRYLEGAVDEFRLYHDYLSDSQASSLQTLRHECLGQGQQCYAINDEGQVFGNDWKTYSKDSNYQPQLLTARNEQYLELTDNANNRATAVTLQRPFPGKGHRIEIEFKLYAWGSNGRGNTGADGIALVLSDANRISDGNPRAGSYGGSLGYAQRTGDSGGFEAGWLGIGFDEYGNFSRNSEGRAGGFDRLVPNRVGVRGADSTNYQFLGASNELEPAIDSPANQNPNSVFNPKPGHTYKVLIDGTGDNPSIEVLRKLDENGANNNFESILKLDNLQNQPQMPEQVYLSFTGSTGGETNYHWIKDLSVCSVPGEPSEERLHHYQLAFNQNAVLCNGAEVAVKACANADCSETYGDTASIQLASDNGSFAPSSLNWSAANNQLLSQLNPTQAGVTNLSVTNQSAPQPANPTVCLVDGVVDDCQIAISNAGFVFYDAGLQSTQIPRQTAGIQSEGVSIRAVETNTNTLQCQALTNNLTQIEMQLDCVDPNQCRSESEFWVSGQVGSELTAANATDLIAGNYQNVAVEFNDSRANLAMRYDDVGAVKLSAKATLSNGVTLRGDSNTFVWQPHHIEMKSTRLDTDLSSSTAILAKAGDPFEVELTARNAQGDITPNFGLEQVGERLVLQTAAEAVAPVAVNDGVLANALQFSRSDFGTFTNNQVTYSEVGKANITAQVAQQNGGGYLSQWQDTSDVLETQFEVGRFIPHHFTLEAGTGFANTCGAQPSYYIGEPQNLLPIQLVARNASGDITRNYASDLAKAELEFAAFNVNGQSFNLQVTPNGGGSAPISPIDWSDATTANAGNGFLSNVEVKYLRSDAEEGPYNDYKLGIRINDGENNQYYSQLKDTTLPAPAGDDYAVDYKLFDSARLVFGRMVLENVIAAVSDPLLIQGQVEFWDGTEYRLDENNTCYSVAHSAVSDERYVVEEGEEAPSIDLERGDIEGSSNNQVIVDQGRIQSVERSDEESLRWEPSNQPVQFEFDLDVPAYLQYDWTGDGSYNENPTALGVFGIYRGSDRQIYWQEQGL
ncbi:putative acyltransferase (DUF342 family) [Idiomarina fontislapidosi]|nr:DUF6701 domain-containing protein [Idiomarina fontislapidosi]PYE33339.1 putative acyltransferase (DUF342 family) [Idiomarina fontislapidosi]